jgi:hypothetical protein
MSPDYESLLKEYNEDIYNKCTAQEMLYGEFLLASILKLTQN